MKYATVCSGIEAPSVAWGPLGWEPVFFSENDKFPSAVLKHHYPHVPNLGDMNNFKEWPDYGELGLICGGTPCQSFSIAGLRKGMDDPRGNLTLTFLGLINKYRPRWFLWENVPGAHSSTSHDSPDEVQPPTDVRARRGWKDEVNYEADETKDFGCFIAGIQELGYSCAGRVLDAQHFGVPQRRRRVFVVGHLGSDWRPPFAVLFEPESLRGNIKKSREAGEGVAGDAKGRTYWEGGETHPPLTQALKSSGGVGMSNQEIFGQKGAYLVMASGHTNAEIGVNMGTCLTRRNYKDPPILAVHARQNPISLEDKSLPLDVKGNTQAIVSGTLTSRYGSQSGNDMQNMENGLQIVNSIVRRLTPMECERLQGFPDGYTLIPYRGKPAADGPRYEAVGNSMAVDVVQWIGKRIELMETVLKEIGERTT